MRVRRTSAGAFTLVEIMIVVSIIGLLAAIAVPNFVRARSNSQQNACIENLREIDAAKQEWALDSRQGGDPTPTSRQIKVYLNRGTRASLPKCPATTDQTFTNSYEINPLSLSPVCLVVTNTHILDAPPGTGGSGIGPGGTAGGTGGTGAPSGGASPPVNGP